MLQWGRARMSAEGGRAAGQGVRWWIASMGPRSDERGRAGGHQPDHADRAASMGPRSDERGRHLTVQERNQLAVLQWGRARMSAEGRRQSRQRLRGKSFNRA